jgi:hypothetical protein
MKHNYKSPFSIVNGCLKADFSKIEITEENALPLSIAKWKVTCSGMDKRSIIFDGGHKTCALCHLYMNPDTKNCSPDCPIGNNCRGTPYTTYDKAWLNGELHEAKKAAYAEVVFLKSLMEEGE